MKLYFRTPLVFLLCICCSCTAIYGNPGPMHRDGDGNDEIDLFVEPDNADVPEDAGFDPPVDEVLEEDPVTEDSPADPDVAELPPGLVWVSISGRTFEMGCSTGDDLCSDAEKDSVEPPSHTVTVSAFEMTETEITQAQYEAVTEVNPSYFDGCGGNCPVEQVDWHEAKAFCEAIGGRLPSEAEWEYAARGDTTTRWTCSDATSSCLSGIAWYFDNSGGTTHSVKGKNANAYSLYDMLGNVWEWVEDCWHDDYTDAPLTGIVWTEGADCTYRVLRGGSWSNNLAGGDLRVSLRGRNFPDSKLSDLGFRCAR